MIVERGNATKKISRRISMKRLENRQENLGKDGNLGPRRKIKPQNEGSLRKEMIIEGEMVI